MSRLSDLKDKAATLKGDIPALCLAVVHPVMPPLPKLVVLLTVSYALSPIDLIPDFIPVLGYLDDLILLPLLTVWAIKLIPNEIMEECRAQAAAAPVEMKKRWVAAAIIILLWLALAGFIIHRISLKMQGVP